MRSGGDHGESRASFWPLLVAVTAIALILVTPIAASSDSAAGPVERSDITTIVLQASTPVYGVDQPVMIRIGIKNVSSQPYRLYLRAPWWSAVLVVENAAGNPGPQSWGQDFNDYMSLHAATSVQPGQTAWLQWEGEEWIDIAHWGYRLGPGVYTISARPRVWGWLPSVENASLFSTDAEREFNADGKTVNSNTITIRIAQYRWRDRQFEPYNPDQ